MIPTLCLYDSALLYEAALAEFGFIKQQYMLIEECGELLNAIAKLKRGRSTKEEIITELADVHIMVEQIAFFFGWEDFWEEKKYKLEKLQDRLSNHNEGGRKNDTLCS